MPFLNFWNSILNWFLDSSERNEVIRGFNKSAKDSFVIGLSPTLLKASVSRGERRYRHQFSSWINTGFRIQALSGCQLTKEEMIYIGRVILDDTILVRRLVSLGWDTLEVHDDSGIYGCKWKLYDYAKIGGLLK